MDAPLEGAMHSVRSLRGWRHLDARHLLAALNTLILVVAQWQFHILEGWEILLLAVAVSLGTESVFGWLLRGRVPNLLNAYISGVSTTLLAKPAGGLLWPVAAVAFLSIASKYVLQVRGRHIWNPTNFGIAVVLLAAPNSATILGHEFSNDWGAFATVWLVGGLVVWRARLLHVSLAYAATFLVLAGMRAWHAGTDYWTEAGPLSGPMYQLFLFFMVTDPPTQVRGWKGQVLVAVLVGVAEMGLRMASDAELAWAIPFAAAPAIFALACVGPLAKCIDLLRAPVGTPSAPQSNAARQLARHSRSSAALRTAPYASWRRRR